MVYQPGQRGSFRRVDASNRNAKSGSSRNGRPHSNELSRLLSAAVVSKNFQQTLLRDPIRALEEGYCGEKFDLVDVERELVLSIRADTLQEFARVLTVRSMSTQNDAAMTTTSDRIGSIARPKHR